MLEGDGGGITVVLEIDHIELAVEIGVFVAFETEADIRQEGTAIVISERQKRPALILGAGGKGKAVKHELVFQLQPWR